MRMTLWAKLSLITLLGLLLTWGACGVRPPAMKQIMHSRDGAPVGDAICVVYSDAYQVRIGGLEKLHPFDINKYERIYLQLVRDGVITPSDVYVPKAISREDILRVHSEQYLRDLKRPDLLARYLEAGTVAVVPAKISDTAILRPFRHATGGTLLASRLALKHGMAINIGGGYHHAEPDRGGGFCIYADMPIAIRTLQSEGLIERALVVDLDVHQGNGTALCIADGDDVYTLDFHEGDIYPIPKEKNDRDVALSAGTTDAEFIARLRKELPKAFDAARPDIVIYQSGVDGLATDPLANFEMTIDGMVERDAIVFAEAKRRGVPIVLVTGGGYSKEAWRAQYRSLRNLLKQYAGR